MNKNFLLLSLISLFMMTTHHCIAENPQQPRNLTLKYIKTPDWSLSETFLQDLIHLFKADVFIESGTFFGTSAGRAAHFFKEVHTMELSPSLYQEAIKRLNSYRNVHVYCGDSSQLLPKILKSITSKIIFWLDGHYSEGSTARGSKNTPVMEELEAIKNSGITDAVILIDDMRCFQDVDDRPENQSLKGYPAVAELEQAILEINKDYQFCIFGDTALAYPASDNVIVSPVIQACTVSRLSDKKQTDPQTLAQAENIIAHATSEEKATIKTLCNLFSQSTQRHGIAGHYYLWYSLILAQEKSFQISKIYANKAKSLGVYCHQ